MGFLEALLLSLALCVDSLVVSATTAFRCKMGWRQGLPMAVMFGLCQGLFPLLGALIGDVARSFIEAIDHWVAFGLLAFVGGKMILGNEETGVVNDEQAVSHKHSSSITRRPSFVTYLILGVATSIDALAVGIGLGLEHPMTTVLWVVALIGAVTLLVSVAGVYLGRRNVPIPERTASIVAGLVLIGLGLKILLEHLLG